MDETLEQERTILFVDIAGSVELYSRVGNVKGKELVIALLRALHEIVERGKGTVERAIGDELLCLFDRADGRGAGGLGDAAVRRDAQPRGE